MAAVFRFAPSPNGRLHLGHAYSALLNGIFALRFEGSVLLRIEDLDPVRSQPDFVAAIESDLDWLGLRFDARVPRQSQRLPLYRAAIETLARRGLTYPCFCSRANIAAATVAYESVAGMRAPRDPDGAPIYPGTCRNLSSSDIAVRIAEGDVPAWRLDMDGALAAVSGPQSFPIFERGGDSGLCRTDPARWGDVVIGRRDITASYHLAVVTDDEAQGVTHVVRGADLLAATDIHVLLQALFGYRTPLYHHHDLIHDEGGDKLAKSRGSRSLADLRAEGWSPGDVRRRLGLL